MLGWAAIYRKLGALSVAMLWLGPTLWHAKHQRTARRPPALESCADACNASSAQATTTAIDLRVCFTIRYQVQPVDRRSSLEGRENEGLMEVQHQ